MLLRVVGSCCAELGTGQTFSYVQTDATTPNIVRGCFVQTDATTPNIVASTMLGVASCKRTQQLPTLLPQQCWELVGPFAPSYR